MWSFRCLFFSLFIGLLSLIAKPSHAELSSEQVEQLQKLISNKTNVESTTQEEKQVMEARIQLAQHYHQLKQAKTVISYLSPVSDKLESSSARILATAYTTEKEYLPAIRLLQKIIEKNDSDYISHHRLGLAYLGNQKLPEAITAFTKAIKINPRFREGYDDLVLALEKAGRRYDLRETLLDMLESFGELGDVLSKTCRYYYEDGFLSDSSFYCQKAIAKAPEIGENHVYLGLTFQATGSKDRALAIVETSARRFKKSEFTQYTAGQMHEEAKNFSKSVEFYQQGTLADNNSARCWLGLARTSLETKNYSQSLLAFQRACALDRTNSVQDFRDASSRLKLEKDLSSWAAKFSSEALRCRYQGT